MRALTLRTLVRFGLFWFSVLPAAGQQMSSPKRPYRVDDYFSTEAVLDESITVSPDGQAVAFTLRRAANTQVSNSLLIPETRSDIWLQEAPGRPARNLTKGQVDSSGWWSPQWSRDGKWLAFLSSRGGEVRVWAWDREGDQLRQLSREGIDFSNAGGCEWVEARRLLCLAMPEGERSTPLGLGDYHVGKAVERAEAAWAKAKRGELTASVVNSLEFKLPQRQLVVVDVSSGESQTLAPTQLLDMEVWFAPSSWWLSPTGQALALVRPEIAAFGLMQRAAMGYPAAVELRRLDGEPLMLSQPLPTNVVTSTLRWSPDGNALAFFALGDASVHPELLYGGPESAREVRYPNVASKEYPGQLWRVDLTQGVVERLPTGDIDLGQNPTPPIFQWTAGGELLFRAPRLVEGARPVGGAEAEWLVLGRGGRTRPLAADEQQLPDELESIERGAAFVGLMEGEVWRVDAEKATAKQRTARLDPRVQKLQFVENATSTTQAIVSWMRAPQNESDRAVASMSVFRSPELLGMAHLREYALLDLTTGAITPLRKPKPAATLVTYDGESESALWKAEDRAGTFLWRQIGTVPSGPLASTNTFWKDVAKGEERVIEYTTLNGERMKARLVLPVGYQKGRRYPLVVDLEIGSTAESNWTFLVRDPSALPDPIDGAFTAAGYAYMFTSWPSTSMDAIGRGNLLLGPNGIIPAVEQAIALGIADPDRLFLYGASSAGYGVYSLVTQTSRFNAATAVVGATDQITHLLQTTFRDRYTDSPFDGVRLGYPYYISSGLPFWRNADLYRRNSPLYYVDRVQTPLLIVQNDMDHHLMAAEMFFKALVMQRKPAQFVRYWGEGHLIETPINFRDYFQRIFAWFDQWGDIARDAQGNMVFEGDRVKSREGAPPLPAEAYAKFPPFGPGGVAAGIGASVEH